MKIKVDDRYIVEIDSLEEVSMTKIVDAIEEIKAFDGKTMAELVAEERARRAAKLTKKPETVEETEEGEIPKKGNYKESEKNSVVENYFIAKANQLKKEQDAKIAEKFMPIFNQYQIELNDLIQKPEESKEFEVEGKELLDEVYATIQKMISEYSDSTPEYSELKARALRIAEHIFKGENNIYRWNNNSYASKIQGLINYARSSWLRSFGLGKSDWIDPLGSKRSAELNAQEKDREIALAMAIHYSGRPRNK